MSSEELGGEGRERRSREAGRNCAVSEEELGAEGLIMKVSDMQRRPRRSAAVSEEELSGEGSVVRLAEEARGRNRRSMTLSEEELSGEGSVVVRGASAEEQPRDNRGSRRLPGSRGFLPVSALQVIFESSMVLLGKG